MHENSILLLQEYGKPYFRNNNRVLEIGPHCFPTTYQTIVGHDSITWHTLDMSDDPNLTYHSRDEYSFPVDDDAYDVVIAGQVLEHVRKIWVWMKEVARVCRTGGHVIMISPCSWPYHEAPVDCWRTYPEGMKALYEDAGLHVVKSWWGSMEVPYFKLYIPGRSAAQQGRRRRLVNRLLGRFGIPVERAYDCITIGRKLGREDSF